MSNEIYDAVENICKRKSKNGVVPARALYQEILDAVSIGHEAAQMELNRLVKEGRIYWSKTLNSISFWPGNDTGT